MSDTNLELMEWFLRREPAPTFVTPWGEAQEPTVTDVRDWQRGYRDLTMAELAVLLYSMHLAEDAGMDPSPEDHARAWVKAKAVIRRTAKAKRKRNRKRGAR